MKINKKFLISIILVFTVTTLFTLTSAFAGSTSKVVDLDAKGRTQQITTTYDEVVLSDTTFTAKELKTQEQCLNIIKKFHNKINGYSPWYVAKVVNGFEDMIFDASGLGVAGRVVVSSQRIEVYRYDTVTKVKTKISTTDKVKYILYKNGKKYKETKLTANYSWGTK